MPPPSDISVECPDRPGRPQERRTAPEETVLLAFLLGGAASARTKDARTEQTYERIKRVLDLALASAALLLLLPLFLVIAAAVALEDGGPVLYSQMRVGRAGAAFRFYKFRSMVQGAEALKRGLIAHNEAHGPIFKMRRDPRVTRIGRLLRRYSLDELPQLVNVFRGEISLVGPRPHLPEEVLLYTCAQRRRHSVPPGLVCLREVCGRSQLTFERWMELDMLYIEHRSLLTDWRILRRCVPAILSGHGAY